MHPLLRRVEQSLAGISPAEPFELLGSWSRSTQRANIVDAVWSARVECAHPLAGIGFLQHLGSLFWVKSPPASEELEIRVSLHAYADRASAGATFSAGIGRSVLPGVPVRCGPELEASCAIGPTTAQTGHTHRVAEIDGASFVVLLLPRALLRTGRNHLWRLRDDLGPALPDDVRSLLTRRRAGSLPA